MNIQKEIEQFNGENRPFYIVAHDNGTFSLCLSLSLLRDQYEDYGQAAFNAYAEEMGEPVMDSYGLYTHGNGYEWEAVFRKAFEKDPNLGQIRFDCEAGGFFCSTKNLFVLKDLGSRFKALAEDTGKFTQIVSEGIQAREKQRQEFAEVEYKIKGRLMRHPDASFLIRTVWGDVRLTPDNIRGLLDGSTDTILVGGQHIQAREFLMQDAYCIQPDLFHRNTYQVITNDAQGMAQGPQERQTMEMTL